MNRHRWLTAGATMLVAASAAHAQLKLRDGVVFQTIRPATLPGAPKTSPTEFNFFGEAAPGRRQNNTTGIPSPTALEPGYEEILVLRNGEQLRGTKVESTGNIVRWSRPDASAPLLFYRPDVQEILSPDTTAKTLEIFSNEPPSAPAFDAASSAGAASLPLAALSWMFLLSELPTFAPRDVLIFKNGDELHGTALAATLQGSVRWRTTQGQAVEFKTGRIAGLRLGSASQAKPADGRAPLTVAELRSGERLRGTLVAVDDQQVRLQHPQMGNIPLNHQQLWRLFPAAQSTVFDGAHGAGWAWATSESPEPVAEPPITNRGHWTHLDGSYLLRNGSISPETATSNLPGWQHPIPRELDRFEIRFELQPAGRANTNCALTLFGGGGITLCTTISRRSLSYVVMNPQDHPDGKWRPVSLDRIPSASGALAMRYFVDTKAGTCEILINGVRVLRVGQKPEDRLVATDYYVRLQPWLICPTMNLSNIWIGPWSGELPRGNQPGAPSTVLRNGDVVVGLPKAWRDGKWKLASDLGPLEVSTEKVLIVDFGGSPEPKHSPGRVRLTDGSLVDVDAFQWDVQGLSAHSATVGDLRLDAAEVSELIFDPAQPHVPMLAEPGQPGGQGGLRPRVMLNF